MSSLSKEYIYIFDLLRIKHRNYKDLTIVNSLIVILRRDKDRLAELDKQVTGIMLGLEQEFERCHSRIASLNNDVDGIDQLRDRLKEASAARQAGGRGGISLDLVTNVIQNMYNFSQGLRSRLNQQF